MAGLGVNIDHVATVRQARRADEPDPVWAATEAELGGADCITIHLREDRRHICDRDLELLRQTVAVKLNLEMAIDPKIVKIAVASGPDQCTLVPEKREELTTEGGLNVVKLKRPTAKAVAALHKAGCTCSAFIEPIADQVRAAHEIGFDAIELWTGGYANAKNQKACIAALVQLRESLELGNELGMTVHGGHGLTYRNIEPLASMHGFSEFNIGHTIVSRAIFVGMREAVRQMKELLIRFAPKDE